MTVHDVAQDGDQVFIVQEYIEGQDLAGYLKSHSMSAEQTAELFPSVRSGPAGEGRAVEEGRLQAACSRRFRRPAGPATRPV